MFASTYLAIQIRRTFIYYGLIFVPYPANKKQIKVQCCQSPMFPCQRVVYLSFKFRKTLLIKTIDTIALELRESVLKSEWCRNVVR